MINFFHVTYYIGKGKILFNNFIPLYKLLVIIKAWITKKLYHNDKSSIDKIFNISKTIQTTIILDRVKNARDIIMINESSYLVVFVIFVEDGLPISTFLGFLFIVDEYKDVGVIYKRFLTTLKGWRLDLNKFIKNSLWFEEKNNVSTHLKSSIYFGHLYIV